MGVAGNFAPAKIAVIGLDRFGASLALALVERGCQVLGIDKDARIVRRLTPEVPSVILDATDEEALRQVDITAFDVGVVTGADFESSLMTTLALKNLGVRHVVCHVAANDQRKILLRLGADRVVEPDYEAARRLAAELTAAGAGERLSLGTHTVATLQVPEAMARSSLSQRNLGPRSEITVLVIQRDKESLLWPPADTVLLSGDVLVVLGTNEAIASLKNLS